MNKGIILFVLAVLVSVNCMAARVVVMKLNYDNGNISLVNATIKYGYSPDRRYQPDYGYKVEVYTLGKISDGFRFKVPNELYVDGTDDNGEISGGKIVMDNINFALVLPYEKGIDKILFYKPDGNLAGEADIEDPDAVSNLKFVILMVIGTVTLILIAAVWYFYKKSK